MTDLIEGIYQTAIKEYTSTDICNAALGDSANAVIPIQISDQVDNCVLCKSIVSNLQLKVFAGSIQDKSMSIAEKLCVAVPDEKKQKCLHIFDGIVATELGSLLYIDSFDICKLVGTCKKI